MLGRCHPLSIVSFLAAVTVLAATAHAEVRDAGSAGFTVTETADISASPARVYDVIIAPARWWSPDHTYSHDAGNLALDARAGGCWCETLPDGGSVMHLMVVNAVPGKMLRLRGALGPLQAMAMDGAMTFDLRPTDNGTRLTMSYTVGGYSPSGFDDLAKAVDSVLGEQVARLRRSIETGSPEESVRGKPK